LGFIQRGAGSLKNRFLVYVGVFCFLTLPLLITSCSTVTYGNISPAQNPESADQSWLADETCSAPCWQGIQPGISSRQDAIQLVEGLSFVDGKNMRTYDESNVGFLCRVPSDVACVSMQFKAGILIDVRLYMNYPLSIKQVVEKLGPPAGYSIIRRRPETKGCDIEFFWIDRQTSVEYYEEPHNFGDDLCDTTSANGGKIPAKLYVQKINYMKPGEMEEKVQAAQKPGTGYQYLLWKGFLN